jgi:prepilin-type processing-associated H-X9-DG protein
MAYDYSGMFHDKDINANGWANLASDYECNPRVMPDVTQWDRYAMGVTGATGGTWYVGLRKISSLRNTQSTMMVWCAGVGVAGNGLDNGSDLVASQLDDGNLQTSIGLCNPPAPNSLWYVPLIGQRIALGTSGPAGASYTNNTGGDTMQSLVRENVDYQQSAGYDNAADMRFRHNNNTTCNALFIDGHCESRRLGSVVGRDICVNPPVSFSTAPGT